MTLRSEKRWRRGCDAHREQAQAQGVESHRGFGDQPIRAGTYEAYRPRNGSTEHRKEKGGTHHREVGELGQKDGEPSNHRHHKEDATTEAVTWKWRRGLVEEQGKSPRHGGHRATQSSGMPSHGSHAQTRWSTPKPSKPLGPTQKMRCWRHNRCRFRTRHRPRPSLRQKRRGFKPVAMANTRYAGAGMHPIDQDP